MNFFLFSLLHDAYVQMPFSFLVWFSLWIVSFKKRGLHENRFHLFKFKIGTVDEISVIFNLHGQCDLLFSLNKSYIARKKKKVLWLWMRYANKNSEQVNIFSCKLRFIKDKSGAKFYGRKSLRLSILCHAIFLGSYVAEKLLGHFISFWLCYRF